MPLLFCLPGKIFFRNPLTYDKDKDNIEYTRNTRNIVYRVYIMYRKGPEMEGAVIPFAGAQLTTAAEITPALMERWISFVDATPKTAATYTASIRRFAAYLAEQGVTQPTRETALEYKRQLSAHYRPATVNAYLAAVRLFFRWTASEGIYPNIADNVKGAKLDKGHKKDALTQGQAREVLGCIERDTERGARDYAIVVTMITGGLRDVEITRANIEDIAVRGGDPRLYVQGKGHEERGEYVKLPPETLEAIREYLQLRTNAEGRKLDASAPLFASLSNNNHGGRMTTRAVSGIAKAAMQGAGYDDRRLTAHSLRHTAVTLALQGGEDIRAAAQFARHADSSTTEIYAHDLNRAANSCADTIARLIFREGGEERAASR